MSAITVQSQTDTTPALSGGASNEMRTLTSWEINEVSGGGHMLFTIGGILFIGLVCLDYGEELADASEKLAGWIRG